MFFQETFRANVVTGLGGITPGSLLSWTVSNRSILSFYAGDSKHYPLKEKMGDLRAVPSTCNVDPFGEAGSLLAFDVDNVSIATASATDTVLLLLIPVLPVGIFLSALLIIESCLFQEGLAG